uniref:serine--tRNA ligase n=1 Tax=Syphacia muris TaxID=451379 RepID=A0A0N5AVF8_9BILA
MYFSLLRLLRNCSLNLDKRSLLYSLRPDLDFDFLLDESNIEILKKNIENRKGVGNIELVHSLWRQIQEFPQRQKRSEYDYKALWDKFYQEALLIPNMSHPNVVVGDESSAKTVKTFGGHKYEEKAFVTAEEIGKSWRTVLYPRESCGSRSYALLGPFADLEQALIRYAWSVVLSKSFRPVKVSDIVSDVVAEGCGLQQRSDVPIKYVLADDKTLCLSGTSELGIANMLKSQVFAQKDLPLKFTALSRCFRPEISKSAHESRLYRVHEFNKIEMFVVCEPKDSDRILQEIVDIQCLIFGSLGLHCRLLDMPSMELGASASRKFDVEAWMPGRRVYGEVSSASNCTDYQSRRLGIKYKDESGNRKFVHTCNGTAIATSRALIALIETLQKVVFKLIVINDKRKLGCSN